MPRFCQLGPNCIGPKKVKAPAGYFAGICLNRDARFCSAACKNLDRKEFLRDKRAKERAKAEARAARDKARSEKKIARLKAKGHTCCPNCKQPFEEK